jgi:hypothetical protein
MSKRLLLDISSKNRYLQTCPQHHMTAGALQPRGKQWFDAAYLCLCIHCLCALQRTLLAGAPADKESSKAFMLPNLPTTDRMPFMFHVSTLMLSCAARCSATAAAVADDAAAPAGFDSWADAGYAMRRSCRIPVA